MGAQLIVEALARLPDLVPVPQPEAGVTYAAKIDKAEAAIDWSAPAGEVDAKIRGLSPFPGAWTLFQGTRIKCLASRLAEGQGQPGEVLDGALTVACGTGAVQITRAQREGKGAQDSDTFLRGLPIAKGDRLEG